MPRDGWVGPSGSMLQLRHLAFALLWRVVLSAPLEVMVGQRAFTVQEAAVQNVNHVSCAEEMQRTYLKYGLKVPSEIRHALKEDLALSPPGQASVKTWPIYDDLEYVMNVQVGSHNLSLNLDTGSSDLWVFSTLQPKDQWASRPVHRVYDPKRSGGKQLQGHSWKILYGDMSAANGQVFLDKVTIGDSLTVPEQAIGVATSVSRAFVRDGQIDGLLGLGFTHLNSVMPTPQKTWFDNLRPTLAAPLFASALKRRSVGTYDFGFIDKSKYVGNITWTPVDSTDGFWDFEMEGFSVGNGPQQPVKLRAIADTGSSLWYMPKPITDAYYAKVQGATYNTRQAGWTFPCSAKLPDMAIVVSGQKVVVPGVNMNYQKVSSKKCFGGIQRDTGMESSIFGDVFLKGLYVVFEHSLDSDPRLGFAHQPR